MSEAKGSSGAARGSPEPKVLVIDRSKWLRGDGRGTLRNRDGKMCCLGFLGIAIGLTPERLRGQPRPDSEAVVDAPWPAWLMREPAGPSRDAPACSRAGEVLMSHNDEDSIEEWERERRVAAVFATHGVEVRFVDGTEQPPAGPSDSPKEIP